jgi:hypothetical protein
MLYQLAIYALSKNTGNPRATILYATLAAEAVEQLVLLKDPVLGSKRAEIALRPVNLLQMERLTRSRQGARVWRQRQRFAQALVFGIKPVTNSKPISSVSHHVPLISGQAP